MCSNPGYKVFLLSTSCNVHVMSYPIEDRKIQFCGDNNSHSHTVTFSNYYEHVGYPNCTDNAMSTAPTKQLYVLWAQHFVDEKVQSTWFLKMSQNPQFLLFLLAFGITLASRRLFWRSSINERLIAIYEFVKNNSVMVPLWHLPNMEICKLDACVYMRAHICNWTCFEWTAMLLWCGSFEMACTSLQPSFWFVLVNLHLFCW